MSTSETPELDDIASRALAALILERVADTVAGDGANAATALMALHTDTALPLDVCAAILIAGSWLAGAGALDAQAIFGAALGLQPDDDTDPTDG